jgi:hypothetical protein
MENYSFINKAEIKMKDGTIIQVTENHKFFFGGSYVKIKDILLNKL